MSLPFSLTREAAMAGHTLLPIASPLRIEGSRVGRMAVNLLRLNLCLPGLIELLDWDYVALAT